MSLLRNIIAVLAILWSANAYAVAVDDPATLPQLLRLCIVDNSGSMDGDRIETVQKELLEIARQQPPSPDNPIALIIFGDLAASPIVCTDLPSFENAVNKLDAGSGGTNIAAGLNQGISYLQSAATPKDVWVFLYSDGEDSNQQGILNAEASLDGIFADRQQEGLPQTVFLKRWGNANADLLHRIQSRGRAAVFDAGDLAIRAITFEPTISLVKAEWNPNDPLKLDVEFSCTLDARGNLNGLTLPVLRFELTEDDATGDRVTEIEATAAAVTRSVTIAVSPEERAAGIIRLPFSIAPPPEIVAKDAKVLPLLAASQISLAVNLPADRYTYDIVVASTTAGGTWSEPLTKHIRTPVQLKFDVTCREVSTGSPGELELVAGPGTSIVTGAASITLPASGSVTLDLVLETTVSNSAEPVDQWRSDFEIVATPIRVPPHSQFNPSKLSITGSVTIPPPIVTPIEAKVLSVSAAEWTDLAKCEARFVVETEFDVQGPIGPNRPINLVTTGSVVSVQSNPAILKKGKQRIQLNVVAVLSASPQVQMIDSQVVPPVSDGVIQYEASSAFQYSVTGPKALSLGVALRGRRLRELRAYMADNDSEARVQFEPVVLGMKSKAKAAGLELKIVAPDDPLKFAIAKNVKVASRSQLSIPVSIPKPHSFFDDTVLAGSIELEPANLNAAVTKGRVPLVVVIAAPFKRLLWQLALTLSSIGSVVIVVRLYLTLRRTD